MVIVAPGSAPGMAVIGIRSSRTLAGKGAVTVIVIQAAVAGIVVPDIDIAVVVHIGYRAGLTVALTRTQTNRITIDGGKGAVAVVLADLVARAAVAVGKVKINITVGIVIQGRTGAHIVADQIGG